MSLKFAILAALTERSSTGLELARRFDRSIGYFWSASHQQIYRELERLREAGLVSTVSRPGPPERGQPKEFEILPAGTSALMAWTINQDDPAPMREALFVKVRAAAALGNPGVEAAVTHDRQIHAQILSRYEEIDRRDFQDRDLDAQGRMQRLVLQAGIDLERTRIQWCDAVLTELRSQQQPNHEADASST
ncbi:PadR family transcriptional regulator [Aeromicrobium ginsengisoli]|uniref:PadR family transcriptional regulator n=1 Tax=Aeromicrobium ginsengisoli TaxID=363867 RepID=A0A5M4FFE0_9ACTN|nr:PadR family transcriptional regulator [Aeromicrobium ginsengisoli]KAA1397836.1 PadR family transcriptional regulator [Aeromicrobium ginsengisoli]